MVVMQSYAPEFTLSIPGHDGSHIMLECQMCGVHVCFPSGTLFDDVCDEAWTHTEMHRTEYMRKS
jgi:hypothetical protein